MARWIYAPKHPKANGRGFVSAADYDRPPVEQAIHANIMVDRFYEGVRTVGDNVDIGSRAKYREYLKRTGTTNASDFPPEYIAKEKRAQELRDQKERREVIAKAYWMSVEGKLKRGNNGNRGNE